MIAFIDEYRKDFGVERICRVLREHHDGVFLTSRGYYAALSRPIAARHVSDQLLISELERIHRENYSVYGVRKMWHAARRAGWDIWS